MDITGNTDVLVKLFAAATSAVRVGRPETIAEAIEAYQIFWATRCQARFTDGVITKELSNLKSEWTAFLGREPNADPDDIAAVSTAVTEIHMAIEDVLRGRSSTANIDDLLNSLRRAATAVAVERNSFKRKLENIERIIKNHFKWLEDILKNVVKWFNPNDMFTGTDKAGTRVKENQIIEAIRFCHDKDTGYPIARIDSKNSNRGKKTIADLARDIWAANPSWENSKLFSSGYASCKAFENALREQAKRNPKSFVWLDDQSSNL